MAKIVKYIIMTIILSVSFSALKAQDVMVQANNIVIAYIEDGDTIPQLVLPPVYIFPQLKFKNKSSEKFYWKTVRDVKRTLPYAKKIGVTLKEINAELEKIEDPKEKKKFMRSKEDVLIGQYEPELKKLTLSQGKMLIKLVDRECDQTSYELIKQYRGGARAFFWQGFARLFGANLKDSYDTDNEKDKIVERVITLVEAGQL